MLGKPRILLADDHEGIRREVQRLLEPECEVVGAVPDGCAALRAAEALKPDLVVLAVRMPIMGGIEAARRLRERSPGVRVVFLTMQESPAYVRAALSTGALGYVFKASAHADLGRAIRSALEGRSFVSSLERPARREDVDRRPSSPR
jgi:DNA-binding NarL/FixJ family response regulator